MIAAGWAMDNMKPKDFLWAELPLLTFDAAAQRQAESMIGAAETVASALRRALTALVAEGSARDAEYEQFWSATEGDFLDALAVLSAPDFDAADISQKFLGALGRQALAQFDALALPGLYWKKFPNIEDKKKKATGVLKIVEERTTLMALVYGRSKQGKSLWAGLDVVPPERTTQREVMT
jgi:CRISPR system Cascade subunit CasA